jgi:hypothetical protein
MSVEVRGSPAKAGAGVIINPAANTAKEQIMSDMLFDHILQGNVYTASQGLEATDISSVATEADTTPVASLQSPTGADTIVIPLRVWVSVTDDGNGAGYVDLAFTKAAKQCATVLSLSGTAINVQNHYTKNAMVAAKSTALKGVTASALLTTDYITLAHHHWADAALTTSLIVPDLDYQFEVPLALTQGAALLVYFTNGTTTDAKVVVSFTWAEIPASVYIP